MILDEREDKPDVMHQIQGVSLNNLYGTCFIAAPVDARFLGVEKTEYANMLYYIASPNTDIVNWEVYCQSAYGDIPADARFVCTLFDDNETLIFVFARRQ